ncbi:MAG TPA: ABC transporter permease [Thermoanaerobaculia bacterium]
MKRSRLIGHSLRALRRHRLRTSFIMLGSFVGAAALTLVISAGEAAERKVLATVRQLFGAQSVMVMAGGTQLMSGGRADAARLTLDDVASAADAIPQIAAWDPQQALANASVRHEGNTTTVRVLGASERFSRVWDRGVSRGELFGESDVRSVARVALIGETAARELFGTADPLGGEILIGNVPFEVIGVLEPFGTDMHGMDRDDEIVVPLTTLMRRVMNTDTIIAAKFLVDDPAHIDGVVQSLRRVLRERHALPATRPDDFQIISAIVVQQMVGRTQKILAVYLPLVAAIALLVAAIVAATLMLASVNERVGEIGLRRAVGARVEDVQFQFLVETAMTMLAGAVAGIVAGLAIAQYAAFRLHLGETPSLRAVLIALFASLLTGLLAGVFPARRAAQLDPATALR